jgi:hypothetical protein
MLSTNAIAPSATQEPHARRTILVAFRAAALALWGEEGLAAVSADLPEDARRATIDSVRVASDWVPERHAIAWFEAVWRGPAQKQQDVLVRFVDRMMDHGFGRVRRLLLSFATPAMMAAKAPGLWRHDHTHGVLETRIEGMTLVARLRHHPYVESPLCRLAVAEVYRYALALTRTSEVTATHRLEREHELTVRLAFR